VVGSSVVTRTTRFNVFDRERWSVLRAATPLTISEADLGRLRATNEVVALDEVTEVYLPLSRLLRLHAEAAAGLRQASATFLDQPSTSVPYVIGIAGSVAVGKSTTARVLQALVAQWPVEPRVELVTTDGFLYPTSVLQRRGLMERKGFPESYDRRRLLEFLTALKSGVPEVAAPVYSHLDYDIVPGESQVIRRADVVIVEGINVLQTGDARDGFQTVVSDFFDFSIYVDAPEEYIEQWYVERFLALQATAFADSRSYFHRFASLDRPTATSTAAGIWGPINGPNLRENILPTRERADLILEKGRDHRVRTVQLRES
jgi:type I pantothenate kinase